MLKCRLNIDRLALYRAKSKESCKRSTKIDLVLDRVFFSPLAR